MILVEIQHLKGTHVKKGWRYSLQQVVKEKQFRDTRETNDSCKRNEEEEQITKIKLPPTKANSLSDGVRQSHELIDVNFEEIEVSEIAEVSGELLEAVFREMEVGERG